MSMSPLDQAQVIKSVFDAANSALQVNIVANSSTSEIAQILDGNGGTDKVSVTAGKALKVDASATTQPVSAVSLPLPTGAATSAAQTTGNSSLSSIDGKIVAVNTGAVVVASSALPTGASTSAKQDTEIASLASIDTKTPALGQALAGASVPVVLTAAQISTLTPLSSVTVSGSVTANAGTNLNTSALALDSTLSTMSGKLPATLGAKATTASLAVNIASDQTVPVSIASSPLPTGGATSALQTTGNSSLSSIDGKVPANLTVTSTRLLVDGSGVTQPVSAASLPLPSGASTSALQTTGNTSVASIDTKTPALGQALAAASVPVVLTAAQLTTLTPVSTVTVGSSTGSGKANAPVYNDYSSTAVTNAAYVQLVASTTSTTTEIEIFESGGNPLYLATGAAASEVNQVIIFPGGNGRIKLAIASGTRVSVKSVTATSSTSGFLAINFYT